MKIYLAGPMTGSSFEKANEWRMKARNELDEMSRGKIKSYSPMRGACSFLKNETSIKNTYQELLGTQRSITYLDRVDVMSADLVLVNLLEASRVSIGTMIEIGWANAREIPIVLVMEAGGNPHDHCMVKELCPMHVQTLEEAILLVARILLP
jgi:nucleoside 2-deoxyribosyltransferase